MFLLIVSVLTLKLCHTATWIASITLNSSINRLVTLTAALTCGHCYATPKHIACNDLLRHDWRLHFAKGCLLEISGFNVRDLMQQTIEFSVTFHPGNFVLTLSHIVYAT